MKYDKEKIIPEVLRRLKNSESLRSICEDDGMPDPSTFLKWCDADKELAQQYARAREEGNEKEFEEIKKIADEVELDRDAIAKARLQIEARKWGLSKKDAKKYGDRVTQEHTGEGGGAIQITIKDMS